jgi:NADPH2:quinone reductase
MKAAWYEKGGPAREVLSVGEMNTPAPGPGEVLVRLRASGVNPSDVKNRSGQRGDPPFPRVIPHSDGAGVVEAVGEGVDAGRVGQRVYVYNAQFKRPFGTAAEYVAVPQAMAVALPEGVTDEQGACFGIPAMTAHRCVFADGSVAGRTVLVTGGAGTVGRYAIQFAKWGGAQVVTTVSGPEKAAHAASAGADHIVTYTEGDAVAQILEATGGRGVDRIVEVEFGGNLAQTQGVLKANGIVAAYGSAAAMEPVLPFYPLMFQGVTIRTVLVYILPDVARAQAVEDIEAACASGFLSHAVAETYPLERVADAHESVERADKLGTVVVTLD